SGPPAPRPGRLQPKEAGPRPRPGSRLVRRELPAADAGPRPGPAGRAAIGSRSGVAAARIQGVHDPHPRGVVHGAPRGDLGSGAPAPGAQSAVVEAADAHAGAQDRGEIVVGGHRHGFKYNNAGTGPALGGQASGAIARKARLLPDTPYLTLRT